MLKSVVIGLAACCSMSAVSVFSAEKDKEYVRDESEKDLRGKKFKGEDLEKTNFKGANLSEATFEGANIKDCNFQYADLDRTTLWDAVITGSDFRNSNFAFVSCQGADFSKCNFSGVDISRTHLKDCNFRQADLSKVKGMNEVTNCDFTGADLRGANLSQAVNFETSKWRAAKYDAKTRFPRLFDPEEKGCIRADGDDDK